MGLIICKNTNLLLLWYCRVIFVVYLTKKSIRVLICHLAICQKFKTEFWRICAKICSRFTHVFAHRVIFTCLIGRTICISVEATFLLSCRAILVITLIRNAKIALIWDLAGPTAMPKIFIESDANFLNGVKRAITSKFLQMEQFYCSVALFWPNL